jgi:hypothetical protein
VLVRPFLAAALLLLGACTRQDARLQQHQEKFASFGATTETIGHAWLDGSLSGTYTRTALSETLRLVEQERAALAAKPQMLLDPRGAALSQQAEKLSRVIAQLTGDVQAANAVAARGHLADIPIKPGQP